MSQQDVTPVVPMDGESSQGSGNETLVIDESEAVATAISDNAEKHVQANTLRRIAVRGGLLLVASRLGMQLFTWLATIQVTRLLQTIDYAVLTTGVMIVGFCDMLAEAGVGRALVYRKDLKQEEINETFTLSLILSISIYGVVFALSGWLVGYFSLPPESALFFRVCGLMLLAIPFRTISHSLVERNLNFKKKSFVFITSGVVQSVILLILVTNGRGYWAFAYSCLVGRALETILLLSGSGWKPRIRSFSREARGILLFGFNVSAAGLLWFFCSNSDYAVVGRVTGPINLGYYGLAFQLITIPVQKLTSSFNHVAFPLFCRMQNDPERVRSWYLRLVGLLGFFGLPAMIGLALVAEDAFRLILGVKWLPAVQAFQIMSVAGAVMMLSATLPSVFVAIGRPDIEVKYNSACAIILPVSFYIAARLYGMIGVCLVWAVFYPLIIGYLIYITKSLTGFQFRDIAFTLRPVCLGVLAMTAGVLGMQYMLGDFGSVMFRFVVKIASGAAIYAAFHLFVDKQTVSDLWRVVQEIKNSRKPVPA